MLQQWQIHQMYRQGGCLEGMDLSMKERREASTLERERLQN